MSLPVYYLAVDLGASSGRHILGHMENGRMVTEEVYRFENGVQERNGHLCWDYERLFAHIMAGLRRCREIGRIPSYMGIDTWGVDFVLLDRTGAVLGDTVAYRDSRTAGMQEAVNRILPADELFRRTGVAYQPFNTLYQLAAIQKETPELIGKAKTLLMVPSYFHYRLTGVCANEYTMASTSQMVNAETGNWDYEIIGRLGLPCDLFGELHRPGSRVGRFSPQIRAELGFDCCVVQPATHDTASAVVAVPCEQDGFAYISSGTWSLIGTELPSPNTTEASRLAGFTNEGGYRGRYRYLKNIMGLWMIQSARREWREAGEEYGYDRLCELAREADDFPSRVPVEDTRFLAPESMIAEVQAACRESGQPVPHTVAEISAVIYRSLAAGYREALTEIEKNTGRHFDALCIVGGGSKAGYLNELTARETGRRVLAGPGEATAIGNLAVQMISTGALTGLRNARRVIRASFGVETVEVTK